MIDDEVWPREGRHRAFLQRLQSSGAAIKRWWGSDSGRYNTGYFYLVIASLLALLAGYRIADGRNEALLLEIAGLNQKLVAAQGAITDNRCIGLIEPNARDPKTWPMTDHCRVVIDDTRRLLGLPPLTTP